MTLSNNFRLKLPVWFRNIDPVSQLIFLSLGVASVGLIVITVWRLGIQLTGPTITLVAGDTTGESYIISEAIKKVVERRSNINIKVIATGGTSANLAMLEKGEAELATAQADVVSVGLSANSKTETSNSANTPQPQTVAILYKDLFQLVVRDPSIQQFVQLREKKIALPARGGQYQSFLKIAEHYGLVEEGQPPKNITIAGLNNKYYDDQQAEEDFKFQRADALFRVRALGNQGISSLIKNHGGKLLAIPQAEAMKIKQPAFEQSIIPQGAYRGEPPVPSEDLPTVAVSRLLVASDKADPDVIRQITRILFENRREIADAISKMHPEVKPLIANIERPSAVGGNIPPIHPGAVAFFERDQPSFVQENADFLALILTVILLTFSWVQQLKSWLESKRKDASDEYIESATKLMNRDQGDPEKRQKKLDEVFNEAVKALVDEKISQESFRTFNEAYKTSRENIERERQLTQEEVEQKQRELSATYIKALLELLRDGVKDQNSYQQKIDTLLKEISEKLIQEEISQESFRTFMEAYKIARDTIAKSYN